MSDSAGYDLESLLERIRQGDDAAAAEFVERYGPELRREIRLLLWNPSIRTAVDSQDVWQSVMLCVFQKLSSDGEPLNAAELSRLLRVIAERKTTSLIRRQYAAKRDVRREVSLVDEIYHEKSATDPSPSEALYRKELREKLDASLSPTDRILLAEYLLKRSWVEIGKILNITANAARKRFATICERLKLLARDRLAGEM